MGVQSALEEEKQSTDDHFHDDNGIRSGPWRDVDALDIACSERSDETDVDNAKDVVLSSLSQPSEAETCDTDVSVDHFTTLVQDCRNIIHGESAVQLTEAHADSCAMQLETMTVG